MNEYALEYSETLRRVYVVKATSLEEAIDKLDTAGECGEIQLTADDYAGYDVTVSDAANPDGTATEYQKKYWDRLECDY